MFNSAKDDIPCTHRRSRDDKFAARNAVKEHKTSQAHVCELPITVLAGYLMRDLRGAAATRLEFLTAYEVPFLCIAIGLSY
jgi:hypothetical protein